MCSPENSNKRIRKSSKPASSSHSRIFSTSHADRSGRCELRSSSRSCPRARRSEIRFRQAWVFSMSSSMPSRSPMASSRSKRSSRWISAAPGGLARKASSPSSSQRMRISSSRVRADTAHAPGSCLSGRSGRAARSAAPTDPRLPADRKARDAGQIGNSVPRCRSPSRRGSARRLSPRKTPRSGRAGAA